MRNNRKTLTSLGFVGRSLFRQPVRTLLTLIGVSVGVVAVTAFTAVARGLWGMTDEAVQIGTADLAVFQANVAADIFSTLDEQTTRRELGSLPQVNAVSPGLSSIMRTDRTPFAVAMGWPLEEFPFQELRMVEGRKPQNGDEVVVGRVNAKIQKVTVDDSLQISGKPYRVVGIFETGVVFIDGAILMDLRSMQSLANKPGKATAFLVRLEPGAAVKDVVHAIESAHPELVAISSASEYRKVDQGLLVLDSLLWAISLMAIVIGGTIVMNTMWMSVYERTREIGVLRALGWGRGRVVGVILTESAGVGALAGVVGTAAGMGLAELARRLPVTGQFLDPRYSLQGFGLSMLVAVAIGALGGLLPAWKASSFSPVEALRYE